MKIHWKSSFLVFYAICFAAIVAPAESPSSAYQGAVARPQSNIASKHRAALARGGADILLIQTSDPWEESGDYVGANWYDGVTSDTMVLDTLGKSYHIATWSDIQSGSVDIFSYQVILIVDDQVQQFYDDYALKKSQFEQYVKSGGTLLFFAAGAGWAKGQLNANLPGDVTWEYNYDYNNYIAKVNHPIVTDVLSEHTPLQNADLYSYYCSHGYFASLVAGTSVILVNSDGNPTLIEYRLGKGTVIASTLTWEHDWHEHNGGDQYGTFARKALDDVFLYAFYIAGGYVSAQLNVDIYPEDMWQPKRPTLFKAQGDLIDVVAVVQNNSTNTISGVTLELDIANVLADPSFIKVYRRKSGDHIAIELPTELTSGADYTDQTVAGKRIITISNLTIPVQALMQQHVWNDFVFRFRLRNPLAKGTTIDATATVSASGFTSSAAKLSDGGDIKVLANGRVIVTSREALYTYANPNNVGKVDWNVVAQIQALWQSLYRIAANRAAVIEFVDKEEYVADTDHSITSDIIRYWPYHRQHLSNGVVDTYGNYHYSATSTASDEPIINQVAVKVRQYLDNHIVRSGGIPASGREVLILGGDNIVPFYRKWDMMPSRDKPSTTTTLEYSGGYNATPVTLTDAQHNYLFCDMFYRATNTTSWFTGNVDDVYVGRIAGADVDSMDLLLNSTDSTAHDSANVVAVQDADWSGCQSDYETEAGVIGFNLIESVAGVTLDYIGTGDDPERWNNAFEPLFTAQDFEVFKIAAHGSVTEVASRRPNFSPFFMGKDIANNETAITENFSQYSPILVFDSCLVGLVDSNSYDNLLNALFRVSPGGILGSSGVVWIQYSSRHNNLFTEALFNGYPAGYSLVLANKVYTDSDAYSKQEMNYFGCPWFTVAPVAPAGMQSRTKKHAGPRIMASRILANQGTSAQVITIDASNYQTTNVNGYAIVNLASFNLSRLDGQPVVPSATYVLDLPADAQNCTVTVTPSNVVNLGLLNIPTYVSPPPMQAPPSTYPPNGYTNCPNNLGVYPTPQESHVIAAIGGKQVVRITVFPLQYNTETRQATLAKNLTLTVNYTTTTKGVVNQFTTAGEQYAPSQKIPTTTTIKNTSSAAAMFSVTLKITDLSGNVVGSQTTNQIVQSGVTTDIGLNLTAPVTPGLYHLEMTASDGGIAGAVGSGGQYVQVINGAISGFIAPDTFTAGQPGLLQVSFQNMSHSAVTATVNIAILSLGGGQVAELPQFVQTVAGLTTTNLTTQWIPSSDLPNGFYYASAVVTVNGTTIGPAITYFTIGTCVIHTSASPANGGTTSGGGTVNYGSTVAVKATTNSWYMFVNWSEGGTVVSTNTLYTFMATTNRNLVAHFNQIFPATIAKLQANLNFTKLNADSISLTAKINLSGITNVIQLTGASLVVNVGDVKMPFTLDNKGRGTGATGTCRLAYTKPTKTKTGFWTLTVTFGKGSWHAQWANYGLDNTTHKSPGVTVALPVMVLVGGKVFVADPTLHYTATQNKTGTAK